MKIGLEAPSKDITVPGQEKPQHVTWSPNRNLLDVSEGEELLVSRLVTAEQTKVACFTLFVLF